MSGTTGGGGLQPIGGQPNSEKTIDFWNVNKSSREDKEPAVNTAVNSVPEPSVSANASEKDSGESDKSESAAAEPEQSRPSLLDAVKRFLQIRTKNHKLFQCSKQENAEQ